VHVAVPNGIRDEGLRTDHESVYESIKMLGHSIALDDRLRSLTGINSSMQAPQVLFPVSGSVHGMALA
jgi:hypothetical protein